MTGREGVTGPAAGVDPIAEARDLAEPQTSNLKEKSGPKGPLLFFKGMKSPF